MDDTIVFKAVPNYQELMNPTISAIRSLGGSASNNEIADQVILDLSLPSHIAEEPHGKGGQTELKYRLGWSRSYLKQYGLIENSTRGVWSLTSKGQETEGVDPQTVSKYVRSLFNSEPESTDEEVSIDHEDGLAENTADETAAWRENLLELLLEIPFDAFERLCQRLLRESGFIEVEVTGKAGDGGIDGQGIIRLAGLISFPVLFQCKRYSGSVNASAVRDFRGAMQGRADKGLILTTGSFTSGASKEATRDGAPPIDLIDGSLLVDLLQELQLGVNSKMVKVVEIDENWFKSI